MQKTLEDAKEFLSKLDKWLCLPGGAQRSSTREIDEFLSDLIVLPQNALQGVAPDSLPYLYEASLGRKFEQGTETIANPKIRERVTIEYIARKIRAPHQICSEMAILFLLLET